MGKVSRIVFVFIAVVLLIFYYIVGGFPIVIENPDLLNDYEKRIICSEISVDSVVNPLIDLDFSLGDNVVFIVCEFGDCEYNAYPEGISKRRVLYCKNNEVLQKLRDNFNLRVTGCDISTVTTRLLCYKDKELVYCDSFNIETHSMGVQSPIFGYAEFMDKKEMVNILGLFKPYKGMFLYMK